MASWTGRRPFHFMAFSAVFAVANPFVPAIAQSSTSRGATDLVNALVVSSAVLRQEFQRKAAESQFALLSSLGQTRDALEKTRADVRLARSKRLDAERALASNSREIDRLYNERAKQDAAFAAARQAYREQVGKAVAEASPQKRAALERFAAGDRTHAFEEIKTLTLLENEARTRAADLASAANLKTLLALAYERILRGEAPLDELDGFLEKINAYDPSDRDIAGQLVASLARRGKNAEAVELTDRTRPYLLDPWARIAFETAALAARLDIQPIQAAIYPLQIAVDEVERQAREKWLNDQVVLYCSAAQEIHAINGASAIVPKISYIVSNCSDLLAKLPVGRGIFFQIMKNIGQEYASNRDINKLRSFITLHEQNIINAKQFTSYPVIRVIFKAYMSQAKAQLAQLTGKRNESIIYLAEVRDSLRKLDTLAGSMKDKFDSEYRTRDAGLAMITGKPAEAAALLEPLVSQQKDPPSDLRTDWSTWLAQCDLLNDYALASVAVGDVRGAQSALNKATPILTALQWAHPLDEPALMRATHGGVYRELMTWALTAAEIRSTQGQLVEAEARLEGVIAALEPYRESPTISMHHRFFREVAGLALAGIAAQRGDLTRARQRYNGTLESIRATMTKEPLVWYPWQDLLLEGRFRLAQLAADAGEIKKIRAEIAVNAKAGRQLDTREPWARDAADWKVGRPIHWHYATRK